MTARETLAAAHQHMTPDAIAAHALVLADFVQAQAGLVTTLLEFMKAQEIRIRTTEEHETVLIAGMKRALELAGSGRASSAANLLGKLLPDAVLDRSGQAPDLQAVADANQLPPSLFNPIAQPSEV